MLSKMVAAEGPAKVLDEWMRAETSAARRLAEGVGVGVCKTGQISNLDGLEVMRRMMAGTLPVAACAQTMHFLALAAEPGKATFQGTPHPGQLNPMGTVNGGWISSILDSAMGCAVLTTLPAGWGYFTIHLAVQYLKVLPLAAQRVRADATVESDNGRDVTVKSFLYGPDGRRYAEATSVCRRINLAGPASSM